MGRKAFTFWGNRSKWLNTHRYFAEWFRVCWRTIYRTHERRVLTATIILRGIIYRWNLPEAQVQVGAGTFPRGNKLQRTFSQLRRRWKPRHLDVKVFIAQRHLLTVTFIAKTVTPKCQSDAGDRAERVARSGKNLMYNEPSCVLHQTWQRQSCSFGLSLKTTLQICWAWVVV